MPQRQSADHRSAIEARLSVELASVLVGARRRAARGGDRQIDTAHLLHSLVESGPDVRAAFGDGRQVARVLGYLVQRSIGYGLRWQASVEDSGAVPVVTVEGAEREDASRGDASLRGVSWEDASQVPAWSPAVAAAMEGALARAEARGDVRADALDLLAALAADPRCRAVEVLTRAGVDPEPLAAAVPRTP
nr:Clp protease N-terminal domain-containing protein [Streptomyces sp. TRM64462]